MNAPCKGCTFREVGCHVRCPMYRMYKKHKEKEMKCNVMRNDTDTYIVNNAKKIRHKMRKAKYGCSVNDQKLENAHKQMLERGKMRKLLIVADGILVTLLLIATFSFVLALVLWLVGILGVSIWSVAKTFLVMVISFVLAFLLEVLMKMLDVQGE